MNAAPPEGDPPARIGSYEVASVLGHGAMGIVYEARGADGTAVALKTCRGVEGDALTALNTPTGSRLRSHPPGCTVVRCSGRAPRAKKTVPW